MQIEKLSSKNYKYTYYDLLLRISLLQRSRIQFFLYHLPNSSEACWIISLNSIRNRSHLKNEYNYCVLKWIRKRFIQIGLRIQILSDSSKFDLYPNKF